MSRFKDRARGPGGAVSLWDLYSDIANVVAKLIGALRRPDETIDIDAWHPKLLRV